MLKKLTTILKRHGSLLCALALLSYQSISYAQSASVIGALEDYLSWTHLPANALSLSPDNFPEPFKVGDKTILIDSNNRLYINKILAGRCTTEGSTDEKIIYERTCYSEKGTGKKYILRIYSDPSQEAVISFQKFIGNPSDAAYKAFLQAGCCINIGLPDYSFVRYPGELLEYNNARLTKTTRSLITNSALPLMLQNQASQINGGFIFSYLLHKSGHLSEDKYQALLATGSYYSSIEAIEQLLKNLTQDEALIDALERHLDDHPNESKPWIKSLLKLFQK